MQSRNEEGASVAEYRIAFSGPLKQRLIDLCEEARAQGRLNPVKAIIKTVLEDLRTNPFSIGEVLYHFKHSGWPVCHVARKPWSVHYAVDENGRVVYLTRIAVMG
jgi:hypothetical protein